ncbi:MAG: nucleotidyltransferase domain-containing protein [Anaerolineae bacterium]|jgi:predicted nucleotidyltransferase|nr:nucleotidyltransferase domain-containing protein [Anaerolineae bacterium]
MKLDQIKKFTPQLHQIASQYGIVSIAVFGSVARGESTASSDVDFLVDMQEGASLFGVGGFIYDVSKLLGVSVDAVPRSTLASIRDQDFAHRIQEESVTL